MQALGVGGDGKARMGRAGDRDGNNGGAGKNGGREMEDHDAMELEERQRWEAAEMQLRMEEIRRAQEMEREDEDEEQEMDAGPSVPKKRKMDDKVRFVTT